jgi:hypothetical protein
MYNAPEVRLVHEWLDSWAGIGLIVVGMQWQGWDLQLRIRRPWLARHILRGRDRSLHRRRLRVGADAVVGGAAGGVGDAESPHSRAVKRSESR